MTKDELKKEAEEWLCNNLHSASEEDFIKAMIDIAEPREKRIAELEKENKVLTQNLEDTEIVNKALEKENAVLKEQVNILDNCDRLGDVITEAYKDQLTKAKDLLKRCYENYIYLEPLRSEIEQFLNSEVEK